MSMADRILVRATINLSGVRCGDRVWVDPEAEAILPLLAGPNPILVPVPNPKVSAFRVQAVEPEKLPESEPPAPVAPEAEEEPLPVSESSDDDPNPSEPVEQAQDVASP